MGVTPMGLAAKGQDARSLTGGTPVPRRKSRPDVVSRTLHFP